MQPLYDPEAVRPMWEELSQCGVTPLRAAADVDAALAMPGTTLIVVNSICGCAAGGARPGASLPLDVYGQVVHARQCGSQIPSFRG